MESQQTLGTPKQNAATGEDRGGRKEAEGGQESGPATKVSDNVSIKLNNETVDEIGTKPFIGHLEERCCISLMPLSVYFTHSVLELRRKGGRQHEDWKSGGKRGEGRKNKKRSTDCLRRYKRGDWQRCYCKYVCEKT